MPLRGTIRAMTSTTLGRPDQIHAYIERLGYREPGILARLRHLKVRLKRG